MNEDLVLHLPFNEPIGSIVAYDYSKSRSDMVLLGGEIVPGDFGNAIKLDGNGTINIANGQFNMDEDFTLMYSLLPVAGNNGFGVRLFFAGGVGKELYRAIVLPTGKFSKISVVRDAGELKVYVDYVYWDYTNIGSLGVLEGIEIYQNNDSIGGLGTIDSIKAIQRVLTPAEMILEFSPVIDVKYYIDGLSLSDHFNVIVSASYGVIDALKRKESLRVSWESEHGEVVDLSNPVFESREIKLDCWIRAKDKIEFAMKVRSFIEHLSQAGTRRLKIEIDPTKPLIYEVYMPSGFEVEKQWRNSTMIGTFDLLLREPQPVKRVIRHIRSGSADQTISLSLSCEKLLTIFWGDGTVTRNVYGQGLSFAHNYLVNGEYDVIIAGHIESITEFSTNGIILWDKL